MSIREKILFQAGFIAGAIGMGVLLLTLVSMVQNAEAAEFLGADVSAYVSAQAATEGEDAFQVGVSLDWQRASLGVSHGTKRMKWSAIGEDSWQQDEWQSGSMINLRVYPFNTNFIRPHIVWNHSSDIMRGDPFNDEHEPTSDFFGLGITVRENRFELDFAYGQMMRECSLFRCGANASSKEFRAEIRGYFWK